MNMKHILSILLFSFLLAACSSGVDSSEHDTMTIPEIKQVALSDGEKLNVVATTNIIGDVVSNIGGENIDLTVLIPQGQNPHSYEPTPGNMKAIESADIIFVNGLDLEEGLMEIIESNAKGYVVPVSAGIEPYVEGEEDHDHEEGEEHDEADEEGEEHDHAAGDPHFWVEPNNVIIWSENIKYVLAEADPANEDVYFSNNASYLVKLLEMDDYIREQIATIPADQRKIVTDHQAFHYYVEQYGLEMVGTVIPMPTTTTGISAADASALVEVLKAEGVSTIFVGTTSDEAMLALVNSIADETGLEIKVVYLLTGSLAAESEPGDTYLDFLRFNTDQIVAGLSQ